MRARGRTDDQERRRRFLYLQLSRANCAPPPLSSPPSWDGARRRRRRRRLRVRRPSPACRLLITILIISSAHTRRRRRCRNVSAAGDDNFHSPPSVGERASAENNAALDHAQKIDSRHQTPTFKMCARVENFSQFCVWRNCRRVNKLASRRQFESTRREYKLQTVSKPNKKKKHCKSLRLAPSSSERAARNRAQFECRRKHAFRRRAPSLAAAACRRRRRRHPRRVRARRLCIDGERADRASILFEVKKK